MQPYTVPISMESPPPNADLLLFQSLVAPMIRKRL